MNNSIVAWLNKTVLPCLPYLLVFLASLNQPIDLDLGWHLQYGRYFFQHHAILRNNIFSTQMTNYHWVNSSWFTDLITYFTYAHFSFFGLSILGALTVTAAFYLFAKVAHFSLWDKILVFPFMLYMESPLTIVSFRGQLVSLVFLGILLYLLENYKGRVNKPILLTIPLFIAWVNVHGEFILGLAMFGIWIAGYLIKIYFVERQISLLMRHVLLLGGTLVVCALACLINPFGIGVYKEALNHFGSPTEKYITEWLPFDLFSADWFTHVIFTALFAVGAIILAINKKIRSYIPQLTVAAVLLAFSFWMRRYAWPAYLVAMPAFLPFTGLSDPKSRKYTFFIGGALAIAMLSFVIVMKWPFSQYQQMDWNQYCALEACSPKAAQYIKDHNFTNNLLTIYGWGGWLIWNYPSIKPSIDGRMDQWRDASGYSAFAAYYPLEQNWRDIDASSYNVVLMTREKPLFNHLVMLANEGKWELVYADAYCGIFIRKSVV